MTIPEPQYSRSRWRAFIRDDRVLTAVILIVWLVMIISIANRDRLWDFKTYYYAAVAQAQGENPYSLEVLNKYSHDEIQLPFVYPLTTCYLFRPFTSLPYKVAYHLWLWLKVAFAICLFWLWRTRFVRWGPLWLVLLIGSGAYLSGLYRDLTAGNVSLIEQAFLWTGFWWLLEDKPYRFAVAVALAAVFKFTLALFLVVVLLTKIRERFRAFALGCALVAGYILLSWRLDPVLFEQFVRIGAGLKEYTASFNQSTLAVFHDIAKLFAGSAVDSGSGANAVGICYLLFAVVVTILTLRTLPRFMQLESRPRLYLTICALCLLYALVMPRMKNYTVLLLIVPTYLVATTCLSRRATIIFALLLVFPRIKMAPPESILGFYQYLHPWIMTVVVWAIFLHYSKNRLQELVERVAHIQSPSAEAGT